MPTRYLKPGIRDSGHIEGLSDHPDAEILYYRLLVTVDDFGRFDGRAEMVKAYCFPTRLRATVDKCMQWLTVLDSAGMIKLYKVDNKDYLQIIRWDNKPRASESKYPPCPADVYNCPQMLPVTVTVTETVTKTDKTIVGKSKGNGKDVDPPEIPEWMPLLQWNGWIEARRKARHPPTNLALRLAIAKLERFREQGHNVAQILANSMMSNWSDLYEPKD